MRVPALHAWPRTAAGGVRLQLRLADCIILRPVEGDPRLLAGADAAFFNQGKSAIGGVVIWDCLSQSVIEHRLAVVPCRFPYIPGLLALRELPALLAAFRKLRIAPQVVFADAHGLAHPRRMGLACYLGLWLDLPTIGCAKSRLCGEFASPPLGRGSTRPLVLNGQGVGAVLRTQKGIKPVFVSPGHLCDCESAARLTLAATTRYRLPDPIRLAHQLVTRHKWLLAR
jgi:deoxyribonuclease V